MEETVVIGGGRESLVSVF
ncbi:hypothetical protein TIFTF001_055339 [Ficus carica]|uniref:Uncharacterized protein n=1 Tax=Ficus carica TaxID=3494 RepID=A0AA88JGM0_FICCA|nr:hypothetical protein TIFTF001_055339 [Ficus carica]